MQQSSEIEISFAQNEDVEAIAAIAKQTYLETSASYVHKGRTPQETAEHLENQFGKIFIKETFFKELREGQVTYFKVTDSNRIIGYAKLICKDLEVAELSRIYLLQSYHGQGIGFQLLKKCFQHSLELNRNKMSLATNPANQTAYKFYTRNGFHLTNKNISLGVADKTAIDVIMQCDDLSAYCNNSYKRRSRL